MLSFKKVCETCAHVYMYDDVNKTSTKTLYVAILKAYKSVMDKKHEGILLHINTHGGDASCFIFLWNFIMSLSIPFYTVNDAVALSAGAILFMTGKQRFMFQNSRILFHISQISFYVEGISTKQLSQEVNLGKMFDLIQSKLISGKISHSHVKRLLQRERLLDVTEALEYNIATDQIHVPARRISVKRSINVSLADQRKKDLGPDMFENIQLSISKVLLCIQQQVPFRIWLSILDKTPSKSLAIAMANYIALHNNNTCIISNDLGSAETLLAVSATKRMMYSSCFMSINNFSQTQQHAMKDTNANSISWSVLYKNMLRQNTQIPMIVINRSVDNTYYVGASQAIKWKMIDEII